MLGAVAVVLALWVVDHYMLNGQITDASIRSLAQFCRIQVDLEGERRLGSP
jgi:hypothetical protein